MVRILVNGCSFTAMPEMWTEYLDFPVDNIATSGNSNERIFFELMNRIDNGYDVIVAQWSNPDRFVLVSDLGERVNFYPRMQSRNIRLTYVEYEKDAVDLCERIYRRWSNDKYNIEKTEIYMKALAFSCERNGIKLLNYTMKDFKCRRSDNHPNVEDSIEFAKKFTRDLNE